MRFRTELKNIRTFASEFSQVGVMEAPAFLSVLSLFFQKAPASTAKYANGPFLTEFTAALSTLEKIAWVRLSDDTVRFTVIPDMGSQVWA
jgi:hypothetical protein